MDLFEAFPTLFDIRHEALYERNLRLISVSGFVYDDQALYFELSPDKYWGRLAQGNFAIGIGLPKVKPEGLHSPYQSLMEYLRIAWRCHTNLFSPGYALLMDEMNKVSLLPEVDSPFMLQMTRPRLGGSIVPDALVQVSYLLPVKEFRWQDIHPRADLLRISRDHLDVFLAEEMWPISDLVAQPWCDIKVNKQLPKDAMTRIVLALRSFRDLLREDNLKLDFFSINTAN